MRYLDILRQDLQPETFCFINGRVRCRFIKNVIRECLNKIGRAGEAKKKWGLKKNTEALRGRGRGGGVCTDEGGCTRG